MAELPESDPSAPKSSAFTPEVLDQTVIAIPLLKILKDERDEEKKAPEGTEALHAEAAWGHLGPEP